MYVFMYIYVYRCVHVYLYTYVYLYVYLYICLCLLIYYIVIFSVLENSWMTQRLLQFLRTVLEPKLSYESAIINHNY